MEQLNRSIEQSAKLTENQISISGKEYYFATIKTSHSVDENWCFDLHINNDFILNFAGFTKSFSQLSDIQFPIFERRVFIGIYKVIEMNWR